MKYLSVCSGIEAATVAWHPLGWKPEAFSEIEKFPSQVLKHHYPDVPNLGDMTKFEEWNLGTIDLLVGGTPCQSFSVAGLRKGLADPRGNLALIYCGILDRFKPKWFVWENVPGVLSSAGGRDFGSFLGAVAELGYGFAYRVLDAQYFGVAQRRRRVFVVGYFGDWRRAAAVLFEPESLRRDSPPRREAGQKPAPTIAGCANGGGANGPGRDVDSVESLICISSGQANAEVRTDGGAPALTCLHEAPIVAHSLRGEGFDASEDGTGRGTPLVPVGITIHGTDGTASVASLADISSSLRARIPSGVENSATTAVLQPTAVAQPVHCVDMGGNKGLNGGGILREFSQPLGTNEPHAISAGMAVRRLTPVECERLQGFPDNYTNIPKAADGPRYKALGNSMAVPVMAWIGKRIQQVDAIQSNKTADCRVDA